MGQIHSHLYIYYNEEYDVEYVLLLDLFLVRWGAKFIGSKIGGLACIITWHTCSQVDVTRNNKSTDELVSISIFIRTCTSGAGRLTVILFRYVTLTFQTKIMCATWKETLLPRQLYVVLNVLRILFEKDL